MRTTQRAWRTENWMTLSGNVGGIK